MSGSPVGAGTVPTVTPLTLLSRGKASPFRIMLWRCWATTEHGIARQKTARSAVANISPVGRKDRSGRGATGAALSRAFRRQTTDPINARILLLHCVHRSDRRRTD